MKPRARRASTAVRQRPGGSPGAPVRRWEWMLLGAILAVHLGLALYGAARNSVTFDENFHVPSGFEILHDRRFDISSVNPPLIKSLCALPALALGARPPTREALASGLQDKVGESFMRENAGRYHTLYFSARCMIALLSVLLGLLIWRWSRRLYGPFGGLVSVAIYALLPESLAHAGVATIDLATALSFLACFYAFWRFSRTGRWRDWAWLAAAIAFAFLVRFTASVLIPTMALLLALGMLAKRLRRPGRLWLGLAFLVPVALVTLTAGYLGNTSLAPLSERSFRSQTLLRLQHDLPGLRLPLPDSYIRGLDRQLFESQAGKTPTYLLGRIRTDGAWYYFPLAALFKWPIGFWGLLLARKAQWLLSRSWRRRWWNDACLLLPPVLFLASAMFLVRLNVGVRYLFPIIPPLCVWMGGLVATPFTAPAPARRLWAPVTIAMLAILVVETATVAPWYLAFFNRFAGGPGGGDRLVNDSNVDWGQGLIALREEMRRRGIARVHLVYHGTTDPSVYGIDYVPYVAAGQPGPESDWIAISSYYLVGLPQRMMTQHGRTQSLNFDFGMLKNRPPDATPAHCMYLYRIR